VWRGGLGGAYRWPTLASVGASLAPPCFRFHTPLIEPDVRICRIRLSEKTHATAIPLHVTPSATSENNRGVIRLIANLPFLSSLLASAFNCSPFPPPELPGFVGTTSRSAIPVSPAGLSRVAS
jgi:hypothetical protein